MSHKSLIMINCDWSYEYPLPMMPNVITIGGLFVKTPKPLAVELEKVIYSYYMNIFSK